MSSWIWMNGQVLPMEQARVNVEDRGFQFADGVYEVIRVYDGRPFLLEEHLERLWSSCEGIALELAMAPAALATEIRRFIDNSALLDAMVYLQVTRGVSARNHVYPTQSEPTILFYMRPLDPVPAPRQSEGVKLITVEDDRWKRCWIKSIALLPNVLAKNAAIAAGADEAVFIENGILTECAVSTFFIVKQVVLITHPVGPRVLPGITRIAILEAARDLGIRIEERPIPESLARGADEIFITSTTREVGWVSHWDQKPVAATRCGPVTLALHEALVARIRQGTRHAAIPAGAGR